MPPNPGNSKGCRSSGPELGKRLNIRIKGAPSALSHGGNHQSLRSSVPGTRRRDQHTDISHYCTVCQEQGSEPRPGFQSQSPQDSAGLPAACPKLWGRPHHTVCWINPSPHPSALIHQTSPQCPPAHRCRHPQPRFPCLQTYPRSRGWGCQDWPRPGSTLEHRLLVRGEGAEAAQGKAAAHLQAGPSPDSSQGVLQVEGA